MGKILQKNNPQDYKDVEDELFLIELDEKDIDYDLEVPASELGMHLNEVGSKVKVKKVLCNKRKFKEDFKSPTIDIKSGDEKIYASGIEEAEVISKKDNRMFNTYGGVGEIAQAKDISKHWLRDDLDQVCKNSYKK